MQPPPSRLVAVVGVVGPGGRLVSIIAVSGHIQTHSPPCSVSCDLLLKIIAFWYAICWSKTLHSETVQYLYVAKICTVWGSSLAKLTFLSTVLQYISHL